MKSSAIDAPLRRRLFVVVGAAILAVGLCLLYLLVQLTDREQDKPTVAVVSSLPLLWPEGDLTEALEASAESTPVKERLEQNFKIIAVDDLGKLKSAKPDVALLAQPRSFTPAELVTFENWISRGGQAIILADPAVQWESSYPTGDPRRPLFTSMLSPLFAHWGIELTLPMEQREGQRDIVVQGKRLQLVSHGAWQMNGESDIADCRISSALVFADCKIGAGRALLLADADMLSAALWQGRGLGGLFGFDSSDNMKWLETRLLEMSN